MATSDLTTSIGQAPDITALKELHYAVPSNKNIIPAQIKGEPASMSTHEDVPNSSNETIGLGVSNSIITNPSSTSNNAVESPPPLLSITNSDVNTSISFSHELVPTTNAASKEGSTTCSSSSQSSVTAITTGVPSHTFTGSQLLSQNSVSLSAPINKTPLSVPQEQNFRWGRNQVNTLLDKVSDHFEDFYDHSVKKKDIWKIIAACMSQEGYKCTSSDCDKKWRNLKSTYLKVLRKQIQGGTDYRFEHFSRLHNLLGKEIDPLGMREQAISDGRDQTIQRKPDSPNYEDSATEDEEGQWSNSSIEHLLNLIQEESLLLSSVNADIAWKIISQKMSEEGHISTVANCRNKWLCLRKTFNYYQQQASVSGSVPLWPFYTRVRHVLSSFRMDDNVNILSHSEEVTSQKHKTGSVLERLEQINTELSVNERLAKLEANVEASQKIREARAQTNNLLQQVLSELRSITDSLDAENHHRPIFEQRPNPSSHISTNVERHQQQHQQHQQNSNNQPGIIIVEAYQDELS